MTDPGYPCALCGVRPDISCPHRPATERRSAKVEKVDGRKKISGGGRYRLFPAQQGLNFRRGKGVAQ